MKDFYPYISPIIAAIFASVLTYLVTVRAKRHEVLTTQRIIAFKAIQGELINFRRYYNACLGEIQGGDFSPRLDDLSQEERKSPLEQREILDKVLADNLIFLSSKCRQCFETLDAQLGLLCSAELSRAANADVYGQDKTLSDLYHRMLFLIEECIGEMYKDLNLPK